MIIVNLYQYLYSLMTIKSILCPSVFRNVTSCYFCSDLRKKDNLSFIQVDDSNIHI